MSDQPAPYRGYQLYKTLDDVKRALAQKKCKFPYYEIRPNGLRSAEGAYCVVLCAREFRPEVTTGPLRKVTEVNGFDGEHARIKILLPASLLRLQLVAEDSGSN